MLSQFGWPKLPKPIIACVAPGPCGLAARGHEIRQQLLHVDAAIVGARQFRVQPGSIGNVGDQPVEPPHVMLDDLQKAFARFRVARQRQRFDRASQRRQRVLQLVADIGGKALDGVDATVQAVVMVWPVINPLSRYRHAHRERVSDNPPAWIEK